MKFRYRPRSLVQATRHGPVTACTCIPLLRNIGRLVYYVYYVSDFLCLTNKFKNTNKNYEPDPFLLFRRCQDYHVWYMEKGRLYDRMYKHIEPRPADSKGKPSLPARKERENGVWENIPRASLTTRQANLATELAHCMNIIIRKTLSCQDSIHQPTLSFL